ncbi:hypothetical protein [Streptomyces sp. BSE7-9]|uniref:hypothetical protein n=1 Tax=Streptomyces sp. BSE7-9 TaxID=2759948 RepID=UPI0018EE70B1|nr:hypothetical protein [Streptomyces sp. BSE7-9]MBJ6642678.1 hypothetical protein [Streptomyces sp. BSE7-9]
MSSDSQCWSDRPHHPDDDRCPLRLILAVPVVLLTVVSAFFLWLAINTRPDGDWDQAAYGGIERGSALAVVSAGAVGPLWLVPSVRRVMRWPWAVPAVVLGVAAVARWVSSGA